MFFRRAKALHHIRFRAKFASVCPQLLMGAAPPVQRGAGESLERVGTIILRRSQTTGANRISSFLGMDRVIIDGQIKKRPSHD